MKKIEDFGNLTITAYVKFKAQSITINNLSPKKKRKEKKKINKIPLSKPYSTQMLQSKPNKYININNSNCKFLLFNYKKSKYNESNNK